jgi:hypothetical protein
VSVERMQCTAFAQSKSDAMLGFSVPRLLVQLMHIVGAQRR